MTKERFLKHNDVDDMLTRVPHLTHVLQSMLMTIETSLWIHTLRHKRGRGKKKLFQYHTPPRITYGSGEWWLASMNHGMWLEKEFKNIILIWCKAYIWYNLLRWINLMNNIYCPWWRHGHVVEVNKRRKKIQEIEREKEGSNIVMLRKGFVLVWYWVERCC